MTSGWSSEHFYSGLLSADPSIASISLDQLLSSNTGQYPGLRLVIGQYFPLSDPV